MCVLEIIFFLLDLEVIFFYLIYTIFMNICLLFETRCLVKMEKLDSEVILNIEVITLGLFSLVRFFKILQ